VSLGEQLRAAGRILNHPIIQAAGNALTILTLLPFVIALIVAGVGRVTDEPFLFVVAICLALGGLVAVVVLALLQGRGPAADGAPQKSLGPEERLKVMDDLFYPPRDDRRELGERCASFATRVLALVEEYKEGYAANLASAYVELLEADPTLDREQAREDAKRLVERNVIGTYSLMHRDEGLELFDAAREEGMIAAKLRREVETPEAYALGEVPNMFRVMARRLGVDAPEPDPPEPPPLAAKLDDLLREGMDLVEELSVPVEPVKAPNGKSWSIEGGPPDGWWEKVDTFEQRIRDLLRAEHPALLENFADGHNGFLRKKREAQAAKGSPNPREDKRPDHEKVLDFMNSTRSGPADKTEAVLGGLAAARRQLGSEKD
jgi:hypothetical protein